MASPVSERPLADTPVPTRRDRGLVITSHGVTDLGRRRPRNEDQFLIASLTPALRVRQCSTDKPGVQCGQPHGHLFVVADGMGGHAAGQEASALALHTIESFLVDSLHWCAGLRGDDDSLLHEFQDALDRADKEMAGQTRRRPELHGMGATVTLAYLTGESLFIAHVGDSRCYLLRAAQLQQLTHDHTLVKQMVERGILSSDEAATHRLRHVVTNVVGGNEPGVRVELHKVALQSGDRILLCSDGLTEMVSDQEIANILETAATPADACQRLVRRANELGGKDNVTVIVVHCLAE